MVENHVVFGGRVPTTFVTDGSGHSPGFPGIVETTDEVTDNGSTNAGRDTRWGGGYTEAIVSGPFPAVSSACLRGGYVVGVGERVGGMPVGDVRGLFGAGVSGFFVHDVLLISYGRDAGMMRGERCKGFLVWDWLGAADSSRDVRLQFPWFAQVARLICVNGIYCLRCRVVNRLVIYRLRFGMFSLILVIRPTRTSR